MKIVFLSVGKKHDATLIAAIQDYTKRISKFVSVSWKLIEPARGQEDIMRTQQIESDNIRRELQPTDIVILLDERGKELSSIALAEFIESCQQQAHKRLLFIVGGAYGVTDEVRQRANLVWSLSLLVFPHQLVRLILAEQIYRAYSIIHKHPYHHS